MSLRTSALPDDATPRGTGALPDDATWRRIEALVLDCDGVLTPGDLIYDEDGRRLLRFDAKDGFALALLARSGLPVAVLSGRPTDVAERRLAELGIRPFRGRCHDKAAGLIEICAELGVDPARCAFVGDDLPDLAAFAVAGLRIAVADSAPEVRAAADWTTAARGGHGAVRAVCEALLKARGTWDTYLAAARRP